MYLHDLEENLRDCKDFKLLDKSFHITELSNISDPNTRQTIKNILTSPNDCMIRWILYNLCDNFDTYFEDLLLNLLTHKDAYIKYKSCEVLTRLYASSIPRTEYFTFIKQNLRNDSYEAIDQAISFLCKIMYNKMDSLCIVNNELFDRNRIKADFCRDETFLKGMYDLVKVKETQYFVLELILILSYDKECLSILDEKKVIEGVISVLSERSREKIMRVCISILKNCVERDVYFSVLGCHDILQVCNSTYTDDEMNAEKEILKERLNVFLKASSSIDNYFKELFGGKLEESPYHYNDAFWEANHDVLVDNKVEIVKALKKYLKSTNNVHVCISANDLYRFVRIAPEINGTVNKYGLRDDLFGLANSSNNDVRFYAIQALSSCIFSEWS